MPFEHLTHLFNCSHNNRGFCRLNFDEAALLYQTIVDTLKPPLVKPVHSHYFVEIGRRHGGSTVLMLEAIMQVGSTQESPPCLFSIDIEDQLTEKTRFLERHGSVIILNDNSLNVRHRDYADEYDFLFIDGDHSYEGVTNDIKHYWNHVALNRYVLFHDAVPNDSNPNGLAHAPGVLQACNTLIDNGFAESVATASSMWAMRKLKNLPSDFTFPAEE